MSFGKDLVWEALERAKGLEERVYLCVELIENTTCINSFRLLAT